MDRGAWQVTVHGVARVGHDFVTIAWQATVNGVAKSQTRLSDFTFFSPLYYLSMGFRPM